MARVEIFIGAFLAGWGIWFFHQSSHLPPAALSYGHLPFLIQKVASSSFLFLGLGLMARALILSHEHQRFILKHPLNLMTIALLTLVFFLLLPKAGPYALAALLFPGLGILLGNRSGKPILTPVLSAAFIGFALVGLWAKLAP